MALANAPFVLELPVGPSGGHPGGSPVESPVQVDLQVDFQVCLQVGLHLTDPSNAPGTFSLG